MNRRGPRRRSMSKNEDLHGNVPDKSSIALVLIDVVSDFEFEDGAKLFKFALPAAKKIANLKKRAREQKIPAIYVNDNFGKWRSDFKKLLEHARDKKTRGSE